MTNKVYNIKLTEAERLMALKLVQREIDIDNNRGYKDKKLGQKALETIYSLIYKLRQAIKIENDK